MEVSIDRLAQEEGMMRKVLDFLPYPFLVSQLKEGHWHNTFVNQNFSREIGYTIEEMPTINEWFEFAYPDSEYRQKVKEGWSIRLVTAEEKGNDSIFMQVLIRTRDFGDRWYEVKSLIADELQMVAFIDIHKAKLQEENLTELNKNRDRILSILSHDLRGPVANLYSLSKMALSQHISKEEFTKMMATLNGKALQTIEFLNTTLEWSRSNFNTIKITLDEIPLKKLADEVSSLYETQYQSKNITLSVLVEPTLTVKADREILTTVLRNLISNAIKFTTENGLIEIRACLTPMFASLEVKDNGIGMSENKIKEIKTSQYSSELGTGGEKGLGIGILLCQNLLDRLGGKLDIESEPNKGTTMKILIKNQIE